MDFQQADEESKKHATVLSQMSACCPTNSLGHRQDQDQISKFAISQAWLVSLLNFWRLTWLHKRHWEFYQFNRGKFSTLVSGDFFKNKQITKNGSQLTW